MLCHISPTTINLPLVQSRNGPSDTLYAVLNGLLPAPMSRLFGPKAKDREQLDLIVVNGKDKSLRLIIIRRVKFANR